VVGGGPWVQRLAVLNAEFRSATARQRPFSAETSLELELRVPSGPSLIQRPAPGGCADQRPKLAGPGAQLERPGRAEGAGPGGSEWNFRRTAALTGLATQLLDRPQHSSWAQLKHQASQAQAAGQAAVGGVSGSGQPSQRTNARQRPVPSGAAGPAAPRRFAQGSSQHRDR